MPPFLAIALKDLRMLLRDPLALFWALAFPVLFGLFFGSVMKVGSDATPTSIPITVVNDPPPDASEADEAARRVRELSNALRQAGLEVTEASSATAIDAVRRGKAALYVQLPAPSEFASVRLGVDPGRKAEAAMVTGTLRAVLLQALAREPIEVPPIETIDVAAAQQGPRSGYEAVFPAMILWGLLGCAAAFAVALVSERSSGTLLRLYAAPFGRASIVLGKAFACALACVFAALALSALGVLALGVKIADPLKYLAAVGASSACFVGITQLLSVLGKTEQAVAGAGWAVLIVLAMCGGAMVPRMLMPDWLLALGAASPVSWGIVALEGATFRALSWGELAGSLALSCAAGAVCFAAAAVVLRMRES